MKKAIIIIISIIFIITGGYLGMEYLQKKNKRDCFGNNKRQELRNTFVIILKMCNRLPSQNMK